MTTAVNVALCLIIQLLISDAARILAVYPVPSISHQVTFRPITMELIKRGHEVVVITPDPMFKKEETPQNLTEIDVHDISYEAWKAFLDTDRGKRGDIVSQLKIAFEIMVNVVDKQLQAKEVKELVKGKGKFDLLITEACVRSVLAFSHVYKVPVIQISSFGAMNGNYQVMGAPMHQFLYPSNMRQKIYNLTMYEKIYEMYYQYLIDNDAADIEEADNKMLKNHFGPDLPIINKLQNNVDMMFLNVNPIWEGNQPVPPSVIHLGGLPQKINKELPADLKTYLDSSKHGVIYLSFGTNVKPSLLPPEMIKTLVTAFSKMPYDVLWKWDKDELPGKSSNIRISKWLPQSDLLKHPKLKVFVTQGGLQSTDEAITAGVPLVGIPMLGDQWYNVEKYVHHKIGLKLELSDITEESFSKAVNTVIEDESFRKNIIRLRSLMNDQPQTPLERGMWWIEHVLRHGGAKHLRSPAANMSAAKYYELDLIVVILSVVISIFFIIVFLLYYLYKYVTTNYSINAKIKRS